MKFFILMLFAIALIFLNSCSDNKLDKIEFVDDFDYVQRNIIEFDSLLAYSNYKCQTNYSFEFLENNIVIEDSKRYKDRKIVLSDICPEARAQVFRLKSIMKILKRNNITYVYRPYGATVSVFGYYYSYYSHMHEIREIVVDKKNKGLTSSRVVNTRGRLVLFAPQEY